MMTDPIADMLTRIRNAGGAGHRWADIPLSKLKVEVARLLKENAFVHDYKVLNDGRHGIVRVYLKYYDGRHVIRRIERVSRPGWRRYVGVDGIPRIRNGLGMAVLSTSKGLLSDRGARDARVGGEVLAVVW
ncbi:MAG: 30S ribosomal protein S8 [Gemmatimonadota bacterium]|nr:30S ribosomal protein S8 [Gemmatimonadota bacterium]MDE2872711.1 30S ribosomal protein S8 [Gemmatimonadota bacterium]